MLTCEHASAAVPRSLAARFAGADAVLAGHRGSDLGALAVARRLARRTGAGLVVGRVSRLVVDLNRSEGRRGVFSEFTADMPAGRREDLLAQYHRPHRAAVAEALSRAGVARRAVVHLGVHSFTPDLPGDRAFEVGLLYDPARRGERALYAELAAALRDEVGLRVLANRPYLGTSDGLTTSLRRRHPDCRYRGLELELHQGWLAEAARGGPAGRRLDGLLRTLSERLLAAAAG